MNIEDYVRTKDGLIAKIIVIDNTSEYSEIILKTDTNDTIWCSYEEDLKSSSNIIDLIEVGDILTFEDGSICKILEIPKDELRYYLLKDYGGEAYYEKEEVLSDFKSIVTHEMFEGVEYKL